MSPLMPAACSAGQASRTLCPLTSITAVPTHQGDTATSLAMLSAKPLFLLCQQSLPLSTATPSALPQPTSILFFGSILFFFPPFSIRFILLLNLFLPGLVWLALYISINHNFLKVSASPQGHWVPGRGQPRLYWTSVLTVSPWDKLQFPSGPAQYFSSPPNSHSSIQFCPVLFYDPEQSCLSETVFSASALSNHRRDALREEAEAPAPKAQWQTQAGRN